MKFSVAAACAVLAASVSAMPTHHYANAPVALAPVALVNEQAEPPILAASANSNAAAARADRDARRDARKKEWQEWAHQEGSNGVPNGTNFVAQILDGVSGIVESALGPLYSVMSS